MLGPRHLTVQRFGTSSRRERRSINVILLLLLCVCVWSVYVCSLSLCSLSLYSLSSDERETRGTLSPEEVYRAACEDLNVTPISYYIRHVNDSHLNLNYRCMGPKAIEAVAISLVGSTMVNTLELEDNWIEAEGLRYLMEMLSENCYIQDLVRAALPHTVNCCPCRTWPGITSGPKEQPFSLKCFPITSPSSPSISPVGVSVCVCSVSVCVRVFACTCTYVCL
uniref:Uncharacterized protein n=1 Tax=Callorhinchus milii TaxID=7868 RepID=A0A4W3IA59_CALMI